MKSTVNYDCSNAGGLVGSLVSPALHPSTVISPINAKRQSGNWRRATGLTTRLDIHMIHLFSSLVNSDYGLSLLTIAQQPQLNMTLGVRAWA